MEECTSTVYARSAWETFGVMQALAKIRLGVRAPPHADAEAPRVSRAGTRSQIHADNQTFVVLSAFSMVAIPQLWRDNSLGKPSRPPSYSSLKISNPPTSPVGRNGLSNGQGIPLKRDTMVPNSVAYTCRNHKCAIQRYVVANQS